MLVCTFNEPWLGRCKNQAIDGGVCCEEHEKEKCSVCGEQATTRCQASIGLMCGIPLCRLCGAGEMCLSHASSGPLYVIRAILGGGPIPGVFSSKKHLEHEAGKLRKLREKNYMVRPTMKEYEEAINRLDEHRQNSKS